MALWVALRSSWSRAASCQGWQARARAGPAPFRSPPGREATPGAESMVGAAVGSGRLGRVQSGRERVRAGRRPFPLPGCDAVRLGELRAPSCGGAGGARGWLAAVEGARGGWATRPAGRAPSRGFPRVGGRRKGTLRGPVAPSPRPGRKRTSRPAARAGRGPGGTPGGQGRARRDAPEPAAMWGRHSRKQRDPVAWDAKKTDGRGRAGSRRTQSAFAPGREFSRPRLPGRVAPGRAREWSVR